jgi:hypothetical protein
VRALVAAGDQRREFIGDGACVAEVRRRKAFDLHTAGALVLEPEGLDLIAAAGQR